MSNEGKPRPTENAASPQSKPGSTVPSAIHKVVKPDEFKGGYSPKAVVRPGTPPDGPAGASTANGGDSTPDSTDGGAAGRGSSSD
jgi:hypothetical protein